MRHARKEATRLWPWLLVWTVVGLAIRVATVLGRPHSVAKGDAYVYHNEAILLVGGHGFIDPVDWFGHNAHHAVQTAAFPPLFMFLVAIPVVFGFKTFFVERLWCCVIGAAGIFVGGLVGREIGGRRVGLIAAFLLAVYPNIWMSDELAMSEALSPLLIAAVLLFAYRFWKQPSARGAIWLGLSFGFAILGRDELALLVIFMLAPLILFARTLSWRQRFGVGAAALSMIILVTGPWIGYNFSRFKDPVFISTGLGVTLASADCDTTFSGRSEGYWSVTCALAAARSQGYDAHADESVRASELQSYAIRYLKHHEGRIIPVELAKLGRGFAFYHPMDQLAFDAFIETRPHGWAEVGLGMYYTMLALSIGGTVLLRRRRIPSYPLWVVGLDVAISMMVTFGDPRYRTTFEVSLVLLSSVQLEWIWRRLSRSSAGTDSDSGADPPASVEPRTTSHSAADPDASTVDDISTSPRTPAVIR
jgi:4-amino-4-deoxy-L-arabinose transferase-like glycosyltransferase